ncbi:transposase [Moritella sp. 24]|uniref:transposase n=1 Tax=Moritella sp. 24 TaxID=2746230 RepID=UPI001BA72317|nr:transposase [Moritella sp. 24]QUM75529.1 transposase [Moritella sp. 24]
MLPNQKLISNNKNKLEWLIVEIAEDFDLVAFSDLLTVPPKRPFTKTISEVYDWLEEGSVIITHHHFPYAIQLHDEKIPPDWLEKRDSAVNALSPMIDDHELRFRYLFGDSAGILTSLIASSGRSRKFVTGSINRFFSHGGINNSLLPHYFASGSNYKLPVIHTVTGSGEVCIASKRGRHQKYGEHHRGINLSDIRNIQAFSKKIPSGDKVVLADLYLKFNMQYFRVDIKPKGRKKSDENREMVSSIHMILPMQYRVSQRAFKYHLKKFVSKLDLMRKQKGSIGSARDLAGKPGVAREGLRGPTCRYEIDSTTADLYIRYPYSNNEHLATGRPNIYLVIDTYSGMIVGLHVGFDAPKWHGAAQALFNAMTDKVEFCAKYGVDITPEEWPCNHPCREVTFDRGGENTDKHIESMIKINTGITAGNFNAYHRGDAKGTVEKTFDTVQTQEVKYEAGKVLKIPNKDAQHASRKSVYTLDEFMHRLIKRIIYLNNYQPRIDSHNFEMSRDGVEFTSQAVYLWGVKNAVMRPSVSKDQLRYSLLPEGKASVQTKGILFQGLYYSCKKIENDDWLAKARVEKRCNIKIRYSDVSTSHIWWRNEETKELIQIDLTTRSEAYKNQQWAHVLHRVEIAKDELARIRDRSFMERASLELSLEEMEKELRSAAKARNHSEAKGIQPNMKVMKQLEAGVQKAQEYNEIVQDLSSKSNQDASEKPISKTEKRVQNLSNPNIIDY